MYFQFFKMGFPRFLLVVCLVVGFVSLGWGLNRVSVG